MKNKIILFLLMCLNFSYSQSASDIGKISLSVIFPENLEGLDSSQLSKIETKVTTLVTSVGLAASGYDSNFVIYPKLSINDSDKVEGGMQNIYVVSCELSLFIKQLNNNIIYSSVTIPVKGYGKDKKAAVSDAINKLSVNNKDAKGFIETGKQKIIDYYNLKCQDIVTKSESLVKMQDYQGAIGLLMTVPEEVACYNNIQQKTIEAYKAYQNQKCITQLQEAKTTLAKNYYKDALNILSQIDPSTKCYKEAEALIKKAEEKVDAQARNQFAVRMKMYNDSVALEKQRIQAAKEIAVEYYRNQPKPAANNYLMIIK
jgi:chaperonin cofactor prefoldin